MTRKARSIGHREMLSGLKYRDLEKGENREAPEEAMSTRGNQQGKWEIGDVGQKSCCLNKQSADLLHRSTSSLGHLLWRPFK